MKKIMLISLAAILAAGCNAQEKNNPEKTDQDPKGSWKVNREFDEAGNLIRYDSIYSWSSSKNMKDLSKMQMDSLMQSYHSFFGQGFFGEDETTHSLFPRDSLMLHGFFSDDPFQDAFGNDRFPMDLDEVQKRMDSLQNQFFERYRNGGKSSEESGGKVNKS